MLENGTKSMEMCNTTPLKTIFDVFLLHLDAQ